MESWMLLRYHLWMGLITTGQGKRKKEKKKKRNSNVVCSKDLTFRDAMVISTWHLRRPLWNVILGSF
ncbi:hypothetical protein VN97_g10383 [Penicillium thymicola]|uniref:Uncharacterized protein n=1 Tax=Penicillium thymicola TaxID=293382 RepID=A0AAI9X4F3_PENTH|nr:hypothetical protein VN97_g10383 [Penicillium thymicola]